MILDIISILLLLPSCLFIAFNIWLYKAKKGIKISGKMINVMSWIYMPMRAFIYAFPALVFILFVDNGITPQAPLHIAAAIVFWLATLSTRFISGNSYEFVEGLVKFNNGQSFQLMGFSNQALIPKSVSFEALYSDIDETLSEDVLPPRNLPRLKSSGGEGSYSADLTYRVPMQRACNADFSEEKVRELEVKAIQAWRETLTELLSRYCKGPKSEDFTPEKFEKVLEEGAFALFSDQLNNLYAADIRPLLNVSISYKDMEIGGTI